MNDGVYLELTYWRGKPKAGYLHLSRQEGERSVRCRKAGSGLVVDYAADGKPIGIEITAPSVVSSEAINALLAELHLGAMGEEELAPLLAASPSPAGPALPHDAPLK